MALMSLSSGQRRALSANSTQAAFAITAGRKACTLSSGVWTFSDGTNTHTVIPFSRYRGVKIGFGGVGADNATANYRVWLVSLGYPRTASPVNQDTTTAIDVEVVPYVTDTSTITLSTAVGVTGDAGLYLSTERIADTITLTLASDATTPDGIGSAMESAYQLGTAGVYSPAANVPAKLIIPYAGNVFGFAVEFDMTGATSMNFDYELTL